MMIIVSKPKFTTCGWKGYKATSNENDKLFKILIVLKKSPGYIIWVIVLFVSSFFDRNQNYRKNFPTN